MASTQWTAPHSLAHTAWTCYISVSCYLSVTAGLSQLFLAPLTAVQSWLTQCELPKVTVIHRKTWWALYWRLHCEAAADCWLCINYNQNTKSGYFNNNQQVINEEMSSQEEELCVWEEAAHLLCLVSGRPEGSGLHQLWTLVLQTLHHLRLGSVYFTRRLLLSPMWR